MTAFSEREEGAVNDHVVNNQNHFVRPSVLHAADAAFETLYACMAPFKKVTK